MEKAPGCLLSDVREDLPRSSLYPLWQLVLQERCTCSTSCPNAARGLSPNDELNSKSCIKGYRASQLLGSRARAYGCQLKSITTEDCSENKNGYLVLAYPIFLTIRTECSLVRATTKITSAGCLCTSPSYPLPENRKDRICGILICQPSEEAWICRTSPLTTECTAVVSHGCNSEKEEHTSTAGTTSRSRLLRPLSRFSICRPARSKSIRKTWSRRHGSMV